MPIIAGQQILRKGRRSLRNGKPGLRYSPSQFSVLGLCSMARSLTIQSQSPSRKKNRLPVRIGQ